MLLQAYAKESEAPVTTYLKLVQDEGSPYVDIVVCNSDGATNHLCYLARVEVDNGKMSLDLYKSPDTRLVNVDSQDYIQVTRDD